MKRLKVMMLVFGMTALMAGCTPTISQDEAVLGSTETEQAATDDTVEVNNKNSENIEENGNSGEIEAESETTEEAVDTTEETVSSENSEDASDSESESASTEDETAKTEENAEPETELVEGTIQYEMVQIESKSTEIERKSWDDLPQQEMNQLTGEWYELWDAELNSLWNRIIEKVTPEKKEELLEEQRAWIKRKEANIKAAGEEALGGTLQPQLENGTAMRYTRKRCYQLAEILAGELGESFKVPEGVAQSIVDVDPTLDHVFEKFEGQWIFDKDRGAVIGVERSETEGDFAPEGSTWTVWVTGGDVISDLDVIDYTDDSITFFRKNENFDSYYQLRFNMEYNVEMAYGNSLDAMDDVVVAE